MDFQKTTRIAASLMEIGAVKARKYTKIYDSMIYKYVQNDGFITPDKQYIGARAYISPDQLSCLLVFFGNTDADYQFTTFETPEEANALIQAFVDKFNHTNLSSLPAENFQVDDSESISYSDMTATGALPFYMDLITSGAISLNRKFNIVYFAVASLEEDGELVRYGPMALLSEDRESCVLIFVAKEVANMRYITAEPGVIKPIVQNYIANFKHEDFGLLSIDNFNQVSDWETVINQWQAAGDYMRWTPHPDYETNVLWYGDEGVWKGGGNDGVDNVPLALAVYGDWAVGYRPTKIRFTTTGYPVIACTVLDTDGNQLVSKSGFSETGSFEISLDFTDKSDIGGFLLYSNVSLILIHNIAFIVEDPNPIIPAATPGPETSPVDDGSEIVLACSVVDAEIFWRYDGGAWNSYDPSFENLTPVIDSGHLIIEYYAVKELIESTVQRSVYTVITPTPVISPEAGPVSAGTVASFVEETGINIYWRYDPAEAWQLYNSVDNHPVIDADHLSIYYYAEKTGVQASGVQLTEYTLEISEDGFGVGGFGGGGFGV